MLGACFRGALHRFGASAKCCGHVFGMLGGPWGSFGGPLGSFGCLLGGPLGVLVGPGNVMGSSWRARGVILEVWGDPWITPGRSECCYFVGVRLYYEVSCFSKFGIEI